MPLCFVIMGFGEKTDFESGRTLDLDKTYKNIIKPAVEETGYQCIRADEIQDSGIIDKSMYALLMHADLVIADISTNNPNAIYELGVRHAVRPLSTIVIKEENGKLPFDIARNRIFKYKHLGEDIGVDEAERFRNVLINLIRDIEVNQNVDSPLYEYIRGINPPKLPKEEYQLAIERLAQREKSVFAISEHASNLRDKNNFKEAAKLWKKAHELVEHEPYFIQQWALCTYKSKVPSQRAALLDSLNIIKELNPDNSTNDPETLGITGAIYKNLYRLDKSPDYLDKAIEYYGKGYHTKKDYYNGENYALCLNLKTQYENDPDEITYLKIQAKKVRKSIIESLESTVQGNEINERKDAVWIYATLANCYFAINNSELGNKFETIYKEKLTADWMWSTYEANKTEVLNLI